MAAKDIRFGTSVREKMMRGVDDLTDAVKVKAHIKARCDQTGDYRDLVKEGIVGPTKVARTALQEAASVGAC